MPRGKQAIKPVLDQLHRHIVQNSSEQIVKHGIGSCLWAWNGPQNGVHALKNRGCSTSALSAGPAVAKDEEPAAQPGTHDSDAVSTSRAANGGELLPRHSDSGKAMPAVDQSAESGAAAGCVTAAAPAASGELMAPSATADQPAALEQAVVLELAVPTIPDNVGNAHQQPASPGDSAINAPRKKKKQGLNSAEQGSSLPPDLRALQGVYGSSSAMFVTPGNHLQLPSFLFGSSDATPQLAAGEISTEAAQEIAATSVSALAAAPQAERLTDTLHELTAVMSTLSPDLAALGSTQHPLGPGYVPGQHMALHPATRELPEQLQASTEYSSTLSKGTQAASGYAGRWRASTMPSHNDSAYSQAAAAEGLAQAGPPILPHVTTVIPDPCVSVAASFKQEDGKVSGSMGGGELGEQLHSLWEAGGGEHQAATTVDWKALPDVTGWHDAATVVRQGHLAVPEHVFSPDSSTVQQVPAVVDTAEKGEAPKKLLQVLDGISQAMSEIGSAGALVVHPLGPREAVGPLDVPRHSPDAAGQLETQAGSLQKAGGAKHGLDRRTHRALTLAHSLLSTLQSSPQSSTSTALQMALQGPEGPLQDLLQLLQQEGPLPVAPQKAHMEPSEGPFSLAEMTEMLQVKGGSRQGSVGDFPTASKSQLTPKAAELKAALDNSWKEPLPSVGSAATPQQTAALAPAALLQLDQSVAVLANGQLAQPPPALQQPVSPLDDQVLQEVVQHMSSSSQAERGPVPYKVQAAQRIVESGPAGPALLHAIENPAAGASTVLDQLGAVAGVQEEGSRVEPLAGMAKRLRDAITAAVRDIRAEQTTADPRGLQPQQMPRTQETTGSEALHPRVHAFLEATKSSSQHGTTVMLQEAAQPTQGSQQGALQGALQDLLQALQQEGPLQLSASAVGGPGHAQLATAADGMLRPAMQGYRHAEVASLHSGGQPSVPVSVHATLRESPQGPSQKLQDLLQVLQEQGHTPLSREGLARVPEDGVLRAGPQDKQQQRGVVKHQRSADVAAAAAAIAGMQEEGVTQLGSLTATALSQQAPRASLVQELGRPEYKVSSTHPEAQWLDVDLARKHAMFDAAQVLWFDNGAVPSAGPQQKEPLRKSRPSSKEALSALRQSNGAAQQPSVPAIDLAPAISVSATSANVAGSTQVLEHFFAHGPAVDSTATTSTSRQDRSSKQVKQASRQHARGNSATLDSHDSLLLRPESIALAEESIASPSISVAAAAEAVMQTPSGGGYTEGSNALYILGESLQSFDAVQPPLADHGNAGDSRSETSALKDAEITALQAVQPSNKQAQVARKVQSRQGATGKAAPQFDLFAEVPRTSYYLDAANAAPSTQQWQWPAAGHSQEAVQQQAASGQHGMASNDVAASTTSHFQPLRAAATSLQPDLSVYDAGADTSSAVAAAFGHDVAAQLRSKAADKAARAGQAAKAQPPSSLESLSGFFTQLDSLAQQQHLPHAAAAAAPQFADRERFNSSAAEPLTAADVEPDAEDNQDFDAREEEWDLSAELPAVYSVGSTLSPVMSGAQHADTHPAQEPVSSSLSSQHPHGAGAGLAEAATPAASPGSFLDMLAPLMDQVAAGDGRKGARKGRQAPPQAYFAHRSGPAATQHTQQQRQSHEFNSRPKIYHNVHDQRLLHFLTNQLQPIAVVYQPPSDVQFRLTNEARHMELLRELRQQWMTQYKSDLMAARAYLQERGPKPRLARPVRQGRTHRSASAAAAQPAPHMSREERKAAKKRQRAMEFAAAEERRRSQQVVVPAKVTVAKLAELLEVTSAEVERILEDIGDKARSAEDIVAPDSAELVVLELGKVAIIEADDSLGSAADAVPRPPVVTIMGHVDHGKTTLLDALRKTSVAAHEAGGITQHIGAFEVRLPGSKESLTFLDTPGHAAFSNMRARGAAVTDICVLVVAADDGVMPQTREALAHIRAAKCPFVVAVTKCDLPNADAARVRRMLLEEGVELEEVGGSVQLVEVAAAKGQGLAELEDALLLQAGEMDLRALPSRDAEAVVVESKMDKGMGPVATVIVHARNPDTLLPILQVIVKQGTLKAGQVVVVGTEWGKLKALRDPGGKPTKKVTPGRPVEVIGLKGLPEAGDELIVVTSEDRARRISDARTVRAEQYRHSKQAVAVAAAQAAAEAEAASTEDSDENEDSVGQVAKVERVVVPIVIKADVWGSAQAVEQALKSMQSDRVSLRPVFVGVGPVSVGDVELAAASQALIVAFNTKTANAAVDSLAKSSAVQITSHRVIYHLLEEVAGLAVGHAPTEQEEVVTGSAEVLQVFPLRGKRGEDAKLVAGCKVVEGTVTMKGTKYRVLRSGDVVFEGSVESLRRQKNEVEQVGKGTECGILLEGFTGFQKGDVVQCMSMVNKVASASDMLDAARTLDPVDVARQSWGG